KTHLREPVIANLSKQIEMVGIWSIFQRYIGFQLVGIKDVAFGAIALRLDLAKLQLGPLIVAICNHGRGAKCDRWVANIPSTVCSSESQSGAVRNRTKLWIDPSETDIEKLGHSNLFNSDQCFLYRRMTWRRQAYLLGEPLVP